MLAIGISLGAAQTQEESKVEESVDAKWHLNISPQQNENLMQLMLVPQPTFTVDWAFAPNQIHDHFGMTLRQISDDVVRQQLGIEDGTGVVVASIDSDGTAYQSGVRPFDIIVAVDADLPHLSLVAGDNQTQRPS